MRQQLLYLSRAGVEATGVSMAEIIAALEVAFREHGHGRVEMPPKLGVHSRPGAFSHAMPAYVEAQDALGLKWVSAFPRNRQRGLPAVSGLVILNDGDSGLPVAAMDCTWITAQRTAAATALSARYLARPDAGRLGVLGCGVQARSNLEALLTEFSLREVVAYDHRPENSARYGAEVAARWGLTVVEAAEPRQAVSGCDIVVTAGAIQRPPHATIKAGWLDPGAFASAVDYDSFWDAAALQQIDRFCTDDAAQLREHRRHGYFQAVPPVHATLGELVAGSKPGRQAADERTMACNLGVALSDVVTAVLVYRRALAQGIGNWLAL